jgi:beta propeller repeat protein
MPGLDRSNEKQTSQVLRLEVMIIVLSLMVPAAGFGSDGFGGDIGSASHYAQGAPIHANGDAYSKVSATNGITSPCVHGKRIVWLDSENPDSADAKDLFMYDTGSMQVAKLTDDPVRRESLDINSDGAVFVEDRLGIFMVDPEGTSIDTVPVDLKPFPNHPPTIQRCHVGGGTISFIATEKNDRTDIINSDPDAFAYDLGDKTTTQYSDLTTTRRHGGQWDAMTDGEHMVFSNNGTAHLSEVGIVDLKTENVVYIRLEDGSPDRSLFGPYDMDDGLVVFEDDATKDIAYFDAGALKFHTIAHEGIDKDPRIQGGKIVWETLVDSGNQYDIFVYDIQSENITRITNDSFSDHCPDIYNNTIVFSSDREGGWGIYMCNIPDPESNPPPASIPDGAGSSTNSIIAVAVVVIILVSLLVARKYATRRKKQ